LRQESEDERRRPCWDVVDATEAQWPKHRDQEKGSEKRRVDVCQEEK
jgi:hypothetical protein